MLSSGVSNMERGDQYMLMYLGTLGTSTSLLYYYYSKRLKPTCTCNFLFGMLLYLYFTRTFIPIPIL